MNLRETLFAHLKEFVPWTSFARILAHCCGYARVSTLPSTEHFSHHGLRTGHLARVLARYRGHAGCQCQQTLWDGTASSGATLHPGRCHERREWRILTDLPAVLIRRTNKLCADEPLGLDVNIAGKVYALDSSTIDLCLSLFDWAPFITKAAIKLHTLLDLRGVMPTSVELHS